MHIKNWSIVPARLFHKPQTKVLSLSVALRDFGLREAEKLVTSTDRGNNRSDNFAALGEWVV